MKNFYVLTILIALCCGGGEDKQTRETPEKEETQQIVEAVLMVIAPKDFRDEEFQEPYRLFTESGIRVTVASADTVLAQGMLGLEIKPDITFNQVQFEEYDALVLVGGSGCELLWDNEDLHEIVLNFHENGKTVAAICIAPVILARAGILRDKEATVFPAVKDEICCQGAQYTGTEVEQCGNIITGQGPQAAKSFAETILNTLKE